MLRRVSVLARLVALVLALLQAAAPAAGAVGEGVLARREGATPVTAHVEDRRQATCPAVHDRDCGLCAALALAALPPAGPAPRQPCRAALAAPGARERIPARAALATRAARAPPLG